jgi:hypothetical protein
VFGACSGQLECPFDRRLHDVGPRPPQHRCALEQRAAVGDLLLVPQRAILVVEQDELVVAVAGVAP